MSRSSPDPPVWDYVGVGLGPASSRPARLMSRWVGFMSRPPPDPPILINFLGQLDTYFNPPKAQLGKQLRTTG